MSSFLRRPPTQTPAVETIASTARGPKRYAWFLWLTNVLLSLPSEDSCLSSFNRGHLHCKLSWSVFSNAIQKTQILRLRLQALYKLCWIRNFRWWMWRSRPNCASLQLAKTVLYCLRKPRRRSIEIDRSTDDQSRGFVDPGQDPLPSSTSLGALSPLSSMELSAEPLSPSTLAFFQAARSQATASRLEEAARLRVSHQSFFKSDLEAEHTAILHFTDVIWLVSEGILNLPSWSVICLLSFYPYNWNRVCYPRQVLSGQNFLWIPSFQFARPKLFAIVSTRRLQPRQILPW